MFAPFRSQRRLIGRKEASQSEVTWITDVLQGSLRRTDRLIQPMKDGNVAVCVTEPHHAPLNHLEAADETYRGGT